jgi:hypothetical protein
MAGISKVFELSDTEVLMADYAMLLRDHVTLKCRSIDRIFLQAYVPKLQSVGQVCIFLRWLRKIRIPSSAAFGKIGAGYEKAIRRRRRRSAIGWVLARCRISSGAGSPACRHRS